MDNFECLLSNDVDVDVGIAYHVLRVETNGERRVIGGVSKHLR
jgi:hypothetical protein